MMHRPRPTDHADTQIIDRIIAQEGFEHVLAVDYKTRRLNTLRSRGMGGGRTSVHDLVSGMQGEVPPPPPGIPAHPTTDPAPVSPAVTAAKSPEVTVKKARPMSMMARAFSSSPVIPESESAEVTRQICPPAPVVGKVDKDEEAKAAKKVRSQS
jgi:hypothetical protein